MDRRRFLVIIALIALVLVLAGCSVVFEAGISGKVVTASGTGTANVQDVSVFAYTDSSLRDSDFAKFQAGTITRPSEGSGYVATTNTNANGEFTVNKIVWETKKSEFGKTADVSKLYLIFYHEDYFPAKADATIISGSTNSSNVYITLEGNKDYTTVNVRVCDIATGLTMTQPCTMEYRVGDSEDWDSVTLTGTATIEISFPKDTTPDVTFRLTSPGANWKMCDSDGKVIPDKPVQDVENGTLSVKLYMKSYEFTLPAFSGSVEYEDGPAMVTFDNTPKNAQDGVRVWLEYVPASGGGNVVLTETVAASHKTESIPAEYGNTVRYDHGRFSNVGGGNYTITITPDEENEYRNAINWEVYENSKTAYIELLLVFEDKYYPFTYTFPAGSSNFDIANGELNLVP